MILHHVSLSDKGKGNDARLEIAVEIKGSTWYIFFPLSSIVYIDITQYS